LSQFSAYDLGALNYNQAFGPDENGQYAFDRGFNEEGGVESQIKEGFAAAKNLAGQGIDFLGEKAVRAGLDYATGGAYEALPEPIKQMIEKVAWGKVKKVVEPLVKIFLLLMVPIVAALINFLYKVGQVIGFFKPSGQGSVGLGAKKVFANPLEGAGTTRITAPSATTGVVGQNQLAEKVMAAEAQALNQTRLGQLTSTKPALTKISSGAMTTASQAVLTTFGLVTGGMLIYQTVINSAFLTQFPTGRYGDSPGSAIFCDDVVVGNLTYYSQKDYNNIIICGGECSFGSSSCGPVAIAMILNEDPIEMSIKEGFLVPGGCGLTSCGGTALSPLIATLNSKGVKTVSVPTPSGSPGQITDELSKYLAEGNLIFALTHTRGFGHYYVITCVESPGYVTAYDPWWGQNVVHKVVSTSAEGLMTGTNNTYIRNIYLVQN